jgi:hypothetical protein
MFQRTRLSYRIGLACAGAVSMFVTVGYAANDANSADLIYESIYQRRGSASVDSGIATYLRRLESNPKVDPAVDAAERAAVTQNIRELQGDELWEQNRQAIEAQLAKSAEPVSMTYLEQYVFDGPAYRVHSMQLDVPSSEPLDTINPDRPGKVLETNTYAYDGSYGSALIQDADGPALVLSDLRYRMAPIRELGRAPNNMPSLETIKASFIDGMMPMSLSSVPDQPMQLRLTMGNPALGGYVFQTDVDLRMDFAIVRSEVLFGGQVVISERYEDFTWVPGGVATPRYALRENFRLENGQPVLDSREEFILVGQPQFNIPISQKSFEIMVPLDTEVIDMRSDGPAAITTP